MIFNNDNDRLRVLWQLISAFYWRKIQNKSTLIRRKSINESTLFVENNTHKEIKTYSNYNLFTLSTKQIYWMIYDVVICRFTYFCRANSRSFNNMTKFHVSFTWYWVNSEHLLESGQRETQVLRTTRFVNGN